MTTFETGGRLVGIERRLLEAYAAPIPEATAGRVDRLVEAAIERRLEWNRGRKAPSRLTVAGGAVGRRIPHRALAASVSVAMLLVVVAVTAIGHVTSSLYMEPKGYVDRSSQQFDLTVMSNGYRVTLERVYADANQIVVGASIVAPAGVPVQEISPRVSVTDSAGIGWDEVTALADPRGRTIDEVFYLVPAGGEVPGGERPLTIVISAKKYAVQGASAPNLFEATFAPVVEVRPGTVVTPARSVTVDGVTVTLDRVAIAPSTVQVDLHWAGLPSTPEMTDWSPRFAFRHDGSVLDDLMGSGPIDGTTWTERTLQGAEVASGHWTVTVTDFFYDLPCFGAECAPQVIRPGPWVFEFDVP